MAIDIIATGDELYEQPTVDASTPSDEPESQDAKTEPTDTPNSTDEGVQEDPQSSTSETDTEEPTDATQEDSNSEKDSTDSDTDESEFYFGDSAVELDYSGPLSKMVEGLGFDPKTLAAELYAKGGEFKLSEETYKKLEEKLPRDFIDFHINTLKEQNEQFMQNLEREQQEQEKADEARYGEMLEMIGGEQAWADIEAFALAELSDKELADVNQIMESGNSFAQNLALMDLQNRMQAKQGDKKAELMDATPAVDTGDLDNSPLDRSEYMRLTSELATKFRFEPEKYAQEQAKLDARRRKAL